MTRLLDVAASAVSALLVQNPAKGNDGDAENKTDIFKDIVGLGALASSYQCIISEAAAAAGLFAVSDIHTAAIQQLVQKTEILVFVFIVGTAADALQCESHGLVENK